LQQFKVKSCATIPTAWLNRTVELFGHTPTHQLTTSASGVSPEDGSPLQSLATVTWCSTSSNKNACRVINGPEPARRTMSTLDQFHAQTLRQSIHSNCSLIKTINKT
jgi:hypothetical protein